MVEPIVQDDHRNDDGRESDQNSQVDQFLLEAYNIILKELRQEPSPDLKVAHMRILQAIRVISGTSHINSDKASDSEMAVLERLI